MKLIIQIPCYNEAETLALTLSELPRQVDGFDEVQWLIIDDGSTDRTIEVARENGVDHIVGFPANQGLARAFTAGLEAAVHAGADVVVNTDADNQYYAGDIAALVEPILQGEADMVVGARPINKIKHFSWTKKLLQKVGSMVVAVASNTRVPDAPSGFRAFSREAAMRLNVFSEYTYTLETIIQAGQKNMAITSVPVRINDDLRPSRLLKSIPSYLRHSFFTIIRIFMTYRPMRFFAVPGIVAMTAGLGLGVRFLYFYFNGIGGHVQSVILSALLLGTGFFLLVVALMADLTAVNRKLMEDVQYRLKKIQFNGGSETLEKARALSADIYRLNRQLNEHRGRHVPLDHAPAREQQPSSTEKDEVS